MLRLPGLPDLGLAAVAVLAQQANAHYTSLLEPVSGLSDFDSSVCIVCRCCSRVALLWIP